MRGMRRSNQRTDHEQARRILAEAEYGVLSTACDDGMPYGIPLNYALSGNNVYFHCAPEGTKLDNIRRDSRACLTAVLRQRNLGNRLTTAYESAMAFGVVHVVSDEEERQTAFRLLAGKYAPSLPEEALAAYLVKYGPKAVILRMEVEYLTGKSGHADQL